LLFLYSVEGKDYGLYHENLLLVPKNMTSNK
jgi:hypothetical protein